MAKAAAAQTTVTLKHLAAALADSHEMAKKQSELILNDLVGMVVKHLKHHRSTPINSAPPQSGSDLGFLAP